MTDQRRDTLGPVLADLARLRADVAELGNRLASVEKTAAEHGGALREVDSLGTVVADMNARLARMIEGDDDETEQSNTRPDHRLPWAALEERAARQSEQDPQADRHRDQLGAWIAAVLTPQYGEYLATLWRGVPKPVLPGCWRQHPAVCNELWTLFVMWRSAYQNPQSPMREMADWHDRLLPGVLHRIKPLFQRCSHTEAEGNPPAAEQPHAARPRPY